VTFIIGALTDLFGIADSVSAVSTGLAIWGGAPVGGQGGNILRIPGFKWNHSTWN
jgi:hypothetical protein